MLEIQKVGFKNFLCFGSRWQELPLLPGVNIVMGYDEDKDKSNGSGKSSFLETIPFALFGQINKNVVKTDIINWKNRRACLVELTFRKGENVYKVRRGIKPNVFDIEKDGELIDKPGHMRDYQAILEDIVGLNFPTFMSLIHTNINSSQPILAMKKPEKRKFIEKVFGLELYSALNDKANEKIRSANDKIREAEIIKEQNTSRITGSELASLRAKIRETSSTELELREVKEELKEIEEIDKDLYDDIREKINEENLKISQIDVILSNIKNKNINVIKYKKLGMAESILDTLEEEKKKAEELKEDVKKYKELVDKFGTSEELTEKIDELNEKLKSRREAISEIEKEESKLKSELISKQRDLKRLQKSIDIFNSGSECPTCGQSTKGMSKEKFKETKNEYEKLKEDVDFCKIELKEEVEDLIYSHKKVKEELESSINSLRRNHIYMLNLYNRISNMPDVKDDDIEKQRKIVYRYVKTLSKLNKLYKKLELERSKRVRRMSTLEEDKNEIDYKIKKKDELKIKVDNLKYKIKLEEENKEQFRVLAEKEQKKIEELDKKNKELSKKIEINKNLVDYLNIIKDICKDENIKQFAISSMIPYLNNRVSHYLSEVGYGFYAIIDKWLDATIKGPGITGGSYGSLSGGEARGIDLALQFAIHDIARLQAGIWPDMISMDEILDSSIDANSINKIMGIITTRQREDNNKIFIVSHREEIDDKDEIDHVYFSTKRNGYSVMEIK